MSKCLLLECYCDEYAKKETRNVFIACSWKKRDAIQIVQTCGRSS